MLLVPWGFKSGLIQKALRIGGSRVGISGFGFGLGVYCRFELEPSPVARPPTVEKPNLDVVGNEALKISPRPPCKQKHITNARMVSGDWVCRSKRLSA